jgi:hypothetical protein
MGPAGPNDQAVIFTYKQQRQRLPGRYNIYNTNNNIFNINNNIKLTHV